MDPAVRALTDRAEISELLMRYCRALDRLNEPLLRSCFHPDSVHNHGYVGASSDFCDFALDTLRGCVVTHHHLGNISVTVDGDRADSECYFTAYHRIADVPPEFFSDAAGKDLIIGGRYIDRHERRDGVWKIVDRIGVHDWTRYEEPCDRGFLTGPIEGRGRRDASDPVWRRA